MVKYLIILFMFFTGCSIEETINLSEREMATVTFKTNLDSIQNVLKSSKTSISSLDTINVENLYLKIYKDNQFIKDEVFYDIMNSTYFNLQLEEGENYTFFFSTYEWDEFNRISGGFEIPLNLFYGIEQATVVENLDIEMDLIHYSAGLVIRIVGEVPNELVKLRIQTLGRFDVVEETEYIMDAVTIEYDKTLDVFSEYSMLTFPGSLINSTELGTSFKLIGLDSADNVLGEINAPFNEINLNRNTVTILEIEIASIETSTETKLYLSFGEVFNGDDIIITM